MKTMLAKLALPALHRLGGEAAHGVALKALRLGLGPACGPITSPRLAGTVAGLALPNPVGLAAGFDKNAVAVGPLLKAGFGFIEVGAATPRPQPGNQKPRLFRLTEDQAAINRFGFNNEGMNTIAPRLARPRTGIVGINLGANKDSENRSEDFARVLACIGPHVEFATVNVSSPNTERLRDLQGKAALMALLTGVMEARAALDLALPVFLKIAPDLEDTALGDIVEVALETGISGIIATNTTLCREGLHSPHAAETGGLSGQPLFARSTRVLARLAQLTEGHLPLIGVGGISTPEQAFAKILAGASAVQLYTALVYKGIGLAADISHGLEALLAKNGIANIADAVGLDKETYL